MPFPFKVIVERFSAGWTRGRASQAYLLVGSRAEELERLGRDIAAIILGESAEGHPDFHLVQPSSKSRRITVQQVRTLEDSLYLKPFRGDYKVALILDADRMCLGQAEPANAFLKTLEEPPDGTFLLLATTRPDLCLATIRSRCFRLDLLEDATENPMDPRTAELLQRWKSAGFDGATRAYAQASILQGYWQGLRADLADQFDEDETDGDEDVAKALMEGEFQLARQDSLAALERAYWQGAVRRAPAAPWGRAIRAISALEDLHAGLQANIDPALAVERACFTIEGVL